MENLKEYSRDFVKRYPNLFTEDKWFWENALEEHFERAFNEVLMRANVCEKEKDELKKELKRLDGFLQGRKVNNEIIKEIYVAMEKLGAKSDLLGTIGSWKDTLPDEQVLSDLKAINTASKKEA